MIIEKIITEGLNYSPEDIAEIYKRYEDLRKGILHFMGSQVEVDGERDRILHDAINHYMVIVPKNVREKLTGMLFER